MRKKQIAVYSYEVERMREGQYRVTLRGEKPADRWVVRVKDPRPLDLRTRAAKISLVHEAGRILGRTYAECHWWFPVFRTRY